MCYFQSTVQDWLEGSGWHFFFTCWLLPNVRLCREVRCVAYAQNPGLYPHPFLDASPCQFFLLCPLNGGCFGYHSSYWLADWYDKNDKLTACHSNSNVFVSKFCRFLICVNILTNFYEALINGLHKANLNKSQLRLYLSFKQIVIKRYWKGSLENKSLYFIYKWLILSTL